MNSGAYYFIPMATLCATLGLGWIGFRAIQQANVMLLFRQWMVPFLLVYGVFYHPKATVLLKDDIAGGAPVAIDNIPLGIAVVSSGASRFSYYMTEMIERFLLPVDAEAITTRKSGLLFGAKALGMTRGMKIEDQTLLDNTKKICYSP